MLKPIYLAPILVLALLSTAAAQESSSSAQRSTLTITVAASGERVRITAPSSIVQMHVEVYAASGEKPFDQEIRGGNVFDWHLQDGQAQRLPAGDYVCVVTAKTISGKITQKVGAVTIAENSASVRAGDSQQFTSPQAQAIGPVETDSSWTIVAEGENKTTTVIANTGSEGQMIRGRGALSFRLGDFFRGQDEEQMRLTEEGNLGIGTSTPQSKLDVAGTIRAERFLVVKPGVPGNKTAGATQTTESASSVQPLVGGTGTTGRLTKWTDGPSGTLGDSVITETAGGNIGIGTTTPGDKLEIAGPGGNITIGQLFGSYNSIYLNGLTGTGNYNFLSKNGDQNLYINRPSGKDIFFRENNSFDQLILKSGGNIGIGTNTPKDKLDIAGPSGNITIGQLFGTNYNSMYLNGLTGTGNYNFLSKNGDQNLYINRPAGKDILFRENNAVDQLFLKSGGNVGIGTTSPQQNLSVNGAMNVDQANLNAGSFSPGISFGSGSGEGIASKRSCSRNQFGLDCSNQFGLDFYTNFLNRMSITNGGNVGIGTNNPGAPLDVQVAAGQSLQFRQDSGLVPGINVKTTGGNAGIMRLRNSMEVWPSDDATRAGRVDVRDTSGSPTITLDGQTGNLSLTGDASFRNMPGVSFAQSATGGNHINPGLPPVDLDQVTVNAPAAGFIFVTAFVYAETSQGGDYLFDFTLSNEGAFLVDTKAQSQTSVYDSDGKVPVHLSWVIPVASAGALHLKTVLFYDNFGINGDQAIVKSHNLTAIYLPKQY